MLKLLTQVIEVARLPMHEQPAAESAIKMELGKLPSDSLIRVFLPALTSLGNSSRRKAASMRCLKVLLALERFRQEKGHWPARLEDLTPKLLKVVEEQRFRRLGDVKEKRVDVRFIAATHHDLERQATRGAFRRDLLYRIYEGHIGDMTAVPLVAVPLHEIAAHALDHRTGFLLSRIDGMLTFEDILDVAGMPRMEAYQILSNLLRKGVIEVR